MEKYYIQSTQRQKDKGRKGERLKIMEESTSNMHKRTENRKKNRKTEHTNPKTWGTLYLPKVSNKPLSCLFGERLIEMSLCEMSSSKQRK